MRKYLEEIGINNFPEKWESDTRQKEWDEQRHIYGFDERDTWSLDYSFYLWLYERTKMFLEVASIDLNCHKFDFKGKEYTQK